MSYQAPKHSNHHRSRDGTAWHVSPHAIDRYCERVDPTASRAEARQQILEILRHGAVSEKPRRWMHVLRKTGCGGRYVRWCARPDICVIVRGSTAATVYSRETCRRWQPRIPDGLNTRPRSSTPYRRPRRHELAIEAVA